MSALRRELRRRNPRIITTDWYRNNPISTQPPLTTITQRRRKRQRNERSPFVVFCWYPPCYNKRLRHESFTASLRQGTTTGQTYTATLRYEQRYESSEVSVDVDVDVSVERSVDWTHRFTNQRDASL